MGNEREKSPAMIDRFLALFFHDHNSYFPQILDLPDKPGDVGPFVFPIDENRGSR